MTTCATGVSPRHIRLARRAELPGLQRLERRSGEIFRPIGMAEVAEDEPSSLAELEHYLAAGRAWVIIDADRQDGALLGYLLAEPVDGDMHIAQVSVDPAAAGRRLGAALIEHLAGVAGGQGFPALTLTTYRDVPWNAPYYRALGFTEIPESELGPGLRLIRELEAKAGLDRWPRLAMMRPL
ncbi:MAG TPA: GNAT family N-acetyltransferase [Pseudonocardia sp.]|uniref:GNAT family N-acetyltransferase n=1 Tax=Pseudonocardia sp. TaxID=60912 RepID=UPI002EDA3716